jgi:hypothetical protein
MKQSASPEEAAAIAAAVERFAAETAPEVPETAPISPWTRAALLEGVGAQSVTIQNPEGGMR